jgi:rhamnulokinase
VRRFLAFDLGAESGRAVLGRLNGARLDISQLARFQNTPLRIGRSLRWDVPAIVAGLEAGLRAAGDGRLDSVGVDAWGCDYGLVGAGGELIEPPYHYRDHRTDGVMARVFARVGRDRIYETTGIQCLPFNTVYQLVAACESAPETLAAAERLLTIPDLINRRLTGRAVNEFTSATTTQCVSVGTGTWAVDLLSELGVPLHLFGEIVQPGTVLGPLSSVEVPALNGTPVVAPACHDTGSAFAAVEAGGSTAFLSCGTWSLLGTEVPSPVVTPRSRDLDFTNEGGVAGTFRLLKNIAGLWLLQACRGVWQRDGTDWAYDDLVRAAREAPHGFRALVDPDDPGFLNPDDMVSAISAYASRTGQPVPAGPPGYTRAILESLALKYRIVLDWLEEVSGRSFTTIRLVGGGSRNALLNQFTANATGRPVLAGPVEATALGNIAVQMVSTGAVGTLGEARSIIDRSFPPERYEPEPSAAWDDALGRLRRYMA